MIEVELSPEGERRLDRCEKAGICPACELPLDDGQVIKCGVHESCYASQNYAIKKGKVTLNELLRNGERRVASTGGRKPATPYAAKLLGREGEHADARSA